MIELCLLQGSVASFGRAHPPLIPAKQRCGAISPDLLESPASRPSQSRWQPQTAPTQSMPAWQPAPQPTEVSSGWEQGSMAQDGSANMEWEPVVSQWEPVVPQPGPSGGSSPQPGQPGPPGSTAEPTKAAASAAQQQQQQLLQPAFMAGGVPPSHPREGQGQQDLIPEPAVQQKHMRGATQSWNPLSVFSAQKPSEPVPEPETPPEAETPRVKQQAAQKKTTVGAKRKHDEPNEAKGEWPVSPCEAQRRRCLMLAWPTYPCWVPFFPDMRHCVPSQLLAVQGKRGRSRSLLGPLQPQLLGLLWLRSPRQQNWHRRARPWARVAPCTTGLCTTWMSALASQCWT